MLGLLNSQLLDFVLHSIASTKQGGYFEYKPMYVQRLPIRTIDFSDLADKSAHHQMVNLVNQMLTLNKGLEEGKLPQEKDMLKRQIEAIDKKIDQLVYKLYDLTDEEIKIVEAET